MNELRNCLPSIEDWQNQPHRDLRAAEQQAKAAAEAAIQEATEKKARKKADCKLMVLQVSGCCALGASIVACTVQGLIAPLLGEMLFFSCMMAGAFELGGFWRKWIRR